jgi:hypothetical protein
MMAKETLLKFLQGRKVMTEKDLFYWKQNAEDNYTTTPISVLSYISKLEKHIEETQAKYSAELDRLDSVRITVTVLGIVLGYAIGKQ